MVYQFVRLPMGLLAFTCDLEENCHAPSSMAGYAVVEKIRQAVLPLGSISVFNSYFDVNLEASKGVQLHEFQSSGAWGQHMHYNCLLL